MFNKKVMLIIAIMTVSLMIIPLQAQSTLTYGDIVTGELTNDEFEVEYTFESATGDVIIVEMTPVDALGDLNSPELILLGTDNRVLTDTSGGFNIGSAVLVAEIPVDGTYTIIAGRRDGRAGDSVGEFTLELIQPEEITIDIPIEGSVSSEGRSQYYLVQSSTTFAVSYEKMMGEMSPQVSVNTLSDDSGGLEEIATAQGDELTIATLGNFSASTTYIVSVGEALFDFNFREVTAGFTLQLQLND
ncbi:MAG: hypothetical protein RLP44_04090 [Aggregatilineales bacterium]